jgi:citrate lyase subunit beta/citryl-CoA lyase
MTETFDLGPALLFCPADRPDRYAKALERADAVIIDLEDAVDVAARPDARAAMVAHTLEPARVIVRVNPVGTADLEADLDAVLGCGYRTVMLPKTGSRADVDALAARADRLRVIALCESAAGIAAASVIAQAPNVVALMWGAEDLVASLGGTSSRFADGRYRPVAHYARSAVLVAAGSAGKAAIDTVHLDISDRSGLAAEAEDAVASGFTATACIHPRQVQVIRDAYLPGAADVTRAHAILDAAADHAGVFRLGDLMVDSPVLRHAEAVLRRAERRAP